VQQCRGVTLNGNTFWMGYEHNLLAEHCTNLSIGPNNLDRNPRYDYGDALQAKNAVTFRDCQDCTISGLHVTNVWHTEAGVLMERCQWMNVANCSILDCDDVALLIRDCQHCLFSGLMIRDARREAADVVALRSENSTDVRIIDNGLIQGQQQHDPPQP
jgi:hypothetical protein